MKFLVDENIGKSIVGHLKNTGYDVIWIKEVRLGMPDSDILKLALKEKRVIVTYDRDFGELVFLQKEKHYGIILLRLTTDLAFYHIKALKHFLRQKDDKDIVGKFWRVDDAWL